MWSLASVARPRSGSPIIAKPPYACWLAEADPEVEPWVRYGEQSRWRSGACVGRVVGETMGRPNGS